METPSALNFINQFTSGHQLTCQTQQSRNYNHKGRITIQQTSQNKSQFDTLRIPTHIHSNPNCDKSIPYL